MNTKIKVKANEGCIRGRMKNLLTEQQIIDRIFSQKDDTTTDLGDVVWKEPVLNDLSDQRFESE